MRAALLRADYAGRSEVGATPTNDVNAMLRADYRVGKVGARGGSW